MFENMTEKPSQDVTKRKLARYLRTLQRGEHCPNQDLRGVSSPKTEDRRAIVQEMLLFVVSTAMEWSTDSDSTCAKIQTGNRALFSALREYDGGQGNLAAFLASRVEESITN